MPVFPQMLMAALALFLVHSAAYAQIEPEWPAEEAIEESVSETVDDAEARVGLADHVDIDNYVDGLVATQQLEHGLGALVVSIVRDDQLWLARGYGLADIASQTQVAPEETLFRIGSVSKTFTWTAVMMLAERDLLDLDADVNDYLHQFSVSEAFGEPVTLRQIMHHRAGFEDTLRLFAVADDDPRGLAELLAEHQPERVYPPGTRTSYSNWASALAALVVENIVDDLAGLTYGDFLQTEILDPLGMNATTWLAPDKMDSAMRERLATGYRPKLGALDLQGFMQIGAYWPAGGMASTATDMARWMRFHLNGGALEGVRLLDDRTHGQMWTRAYNDRPLAADMTHGFQHRLYRDVDIFAHAGGTGAYLTNMVLVPQLSLGIFLSQNSTHTGAPIGQVPDLVIDQVGGYSYRPFGLVEDSEQAEALSEFAGTYLNNRRVFSTFAALFGALNIANVTPLSEDSMAVGAMGETRYYRHLSDDTFVSASDDRIAFVRDEDGRVVAMADGLGVHSFEKLDWMQSPLALLTALGAALLLALSHAVGFTHRFGRGIFSGSAARIAGGVVGLAVLVVGALLGSLIYLGLSLSDFDISTMPETYPPTAMFVTHYTGWAVAITTALMVLAHGPAWIGSGWGWFKRLHFTLFTIAMAFLSVQLWEWRVIGAPVI